MVQKLTPPILSADEIAAIKNAVNPSGANPFSTGTDVTTIAENLTGTTADSFDIKKNGPAGVKLKNSSGDVQFRNLGDTEFASIEAKNVTVHGTLFADGASVDLEVATLEVKDKNISVNKNGGGAAAPGAGFTVLGNGNSALAGIFYDPTTASLFTAGDASAPVELVNINASQVLTNKTYNGVLANVTATTQAQNDNSTKVATTAYVDSAVAPESMWDRAGGVITPHTAGDTLSILGDVELANNKFIIRTATGNASLTGILTATGGFVGNLTGNVTGLVKTGSSLENGVTASTQSQNDNSTKIATTAYVDAAIAPENMWDRSGTIISSRTAGDSLYVDGNFKVNTTKFVVDPITGNTTQEGTATAISFIGPLTGNVTGNLTGILQAGSSIAGTVTAVTQAPLNNSTKIATTAYVDAALSGESFWDRAGNTITSLVPTDNLSIGGNIVISNTGTLTAGTNFVTNSAGTLTKVDFIAQKYSSIGKDITSIDHNVSPEAVLVLGKSSYFASTDSYFRIDSVANARILELDHLGALRSTGNKFILDTTTGNITTTGTVVANNISATLTAGSYLADGVMSTTQPVGDGSNKVATTAYVDNARYVVDEIWDRDPTLQRVYLHNWGDTIELSGLITFNQLTLIDDTPVNLRNGNSTVYSGADGYLDFHATIGFRYNTSLITIDAVTGDTFITGKLDIGDSFTVATTKFMVDSATGNTTIAGTLDVAKDVAVAVDKFNIDYLTGDTLIAGTLGVTGITDLTSDLRVATTKFTVASATGNTVIAGTLDVAKDLKVNTNMFTVANATGNTIIAGTLDVAKDFKVNTNVFTVAYATGNTYIDGTLNVHGITDLDKDLRVNTNMFTVDSVTGNTLVAGTLNATGSFKVNTNMFTVDSANGDTLIAGTLGVTGITDLTDDLRIATTKFTVAAATGNTVVAGTLDVAKDLKVNTNMFTVDNTNGNTLVAGTLNVTKSLYVNTNMFTIDSTNGNTAIAGTLDIAKDFRVNTTMFTVAYATGNTHVDGTFSVKGITDLTDDLRVATTKFTVASATGNTVIAGTLDVAKDFKVNTTMFTVANATGNTHIAGTLNVVGLSTQNGGISVTSATGVQVAQVMGDSYALGGVGNSLVMTDTQTNALMGVQVDMGASSLVHHAFQARGSNNSAAVAFCADMQTGFTGMLYHGMVNSVNKFIVDYQGNTTIAGTLGVTGITDLSGNFRISTDRFTVAAATGDTIIKGTLDVTGALTLAGLSTLTGGISITTATGTQITQVMSNSYALNGVGTSISMGNTQVNPLIGLVVDMGSSAIAHDAFKARGSNAAAADAFMAEMQTGFTGNLFHGTLNSVDKFVVDYQGNTNIAGTLNVVGLSTQNGGISVTNATGTQVVQVMSNSFASGGIGQSVTVGNTQTNALIGNQVDLGSSTVTHSAFVVKGSNTAVANAFYANMQTGYTGNYFLGVLNAVEKFKVDYQGNVTIAGTIAVTGHTTFEGVTSTGATGTGKLVYDTAPSFSSTINVVGLSTQNGGISITNATGTQVVQVMSNAYASGGIGNSITLGNTQSNALIGVQVDLGSSAVAHSAFTAKGSNATTANAFYANMQTGFAGSLFNGGVNGVNKFNVDYLGNVSNVGTLMTTGIISGAAGAPANVAVTSRYVGNSTDLNTALANLDDSEFYKVMSGFAQWGVEAGYYSIASGFFTLLKSGFGFIKGKKVSWAANQVTSAILPAHTAGWLYIDSSGILLQTPSVGSIYTDAIPLFYYWFDGTNYFVEKENHPYSFHTATATFFHRTINVIVRGSGVVISRVGSGTGTLAADRQIQTNGVDSIDDHGLSTAVPLTNPVSWIVVNTNSSAQWVQNITATELPIKYNNGGTPTALDAVNAYAVYTLYALQDDLATATPRFMAVMDTQVFTTLLAAQQAVANGAVAVAAGEVETIEPCQLGYAIVAYSATGGYVADYAVARNTFNQSLVGGGAGSSQDHAFLTGLDYASAGHTGFTSPASVDVFTNKTFDTAATGNVFKVNANQINAYTGTGATVVLSASPTLTGSPLAPTQTALDNSTKIATTAYVDSAVSVENLWDRASTTVTLRNSGDTLNLSGDLQIATNKAVIAAATGNITNAGNITTAGMIYGPAGLTYSRKMTGQVNGTINIATIGAADAAYSGLITVQAWKAGKAVSQTYSVEGRYDDGGNITQLGSINRTSETCVLNITGTSTNVKTLSVTIAGFDAAFVLTVGAQLFGDGIVATNL